MEKKLHSVLEQYDSHYKTYCGNIHIQYTIQFMTLHKHLALAHCWLNDLGRCEVVAVEADGLVHQEEEDDEGGADGQLQPS